MAHKAGPSEWVNFVAPKGQIAAKMLDSGVVYKLNRSPCGFGATRDIFTAIGPKMRI